MTPTQPAAVEKGKTVTVLQEKAMTTSVSEKNVAPAMRLVSVTLTAGEWEKIKGHLENPPGAYDDNNDDPIEADPPSVEAGHAINTLVQSLEKAGVY